MNIIVPVSSEALTFHLYACFQCLPVCSVNCFLLSELLTYIVVPWDKLQLFWYNLILWFGHLSLHSKPFLVENVCVIWCSIVIKCGYEIKWMEGCGYEADGVETTRATAARILHQDVKLSHGLCVSFSLWNNAVWGRHSWFTTRSY